MMMNSLRELPCRVITVEGHPVSEGYSNHIIPIWKELGFKPRKFNAITPKTLPSYLKFEPIESVKYTSKGFRKDHTPTEKAIWYSHVELWFSCVEDDIPYFVLEHDTVPVSAKDLTWINGTDYQPFDLGAMGCYVITPKFAMWMIDFLTSRHGVVDTGPGSMIDWVRTHWQEDLKLQQIDIITHADPRYKHACTQVIDPKHGTVIDHYTGTQAEGMDWKLFPHYQEVDLKLI